MIRVASTIDPWCPVDLAGYPGRHSALFDSVVTGRRLRAAGHTSASVACEPIELRGEPWHACLRAKFHLSERHHVLLDLRSGGLDPLGHARATIPVVLELPREAERAGYDKAPLRHHVAQPPLVREARIAGAGPACLIDGTLVVPDDATTEIGHAVGCRAGLDH